MASSSTTGKAQGLFTRQSSGLVRELGIPAATGIALASVAVVNTFINFYSGLFNFTKVDMILPLLLAALIWFVAMFAYKYLLHETAEPCSAPSAHPRAPLGATPGLCSAPWASS